MFIVGTWRAGIQAYWLPAHLSLHLDHSYSFLFWFLPSRCLSSVLRCSASPTPVPAPRPLVHFVSWQMLDMCFEGQSHFGFPFLVGWYTIISPELQLNSFLGDLIMTISLQGTVNTSLLQILTHSPSLPIFLKRTQTKHALLQKLHRACSSC